jgi:acetoin utilization protein AcuB
MNPEYRVEDFMTPDPQCVSHEKSLLDAAIIFRRTGFRHLPVVDGERVLGILSERDVQRLTPSRLTQVPEDEYNGVLQDTMLGQVMTRDPLTVSPETPLRAAAIILSEAKVGCLPVVKEGRLVGIITVIDMLSALLMLLGVRAGVEV